MFLSLCKFLRPTLSYATKWMKYSSKSDKPIKIPPNKKITDCKDKNWPCEEKTQASKTAHKPLTCTTLQERIEECKPKPEKKAPPPPPLPQEDVDSLKPIELKFNVCPELVEVEVYLPEPPVEKFPVGGAVDNPSRVHNPEVELPFPMAKDPKEVFMSAKEKEDVEKRIKARIPMEEKPRLGPVSGVPESLQDTDRIAVIYKPSRNPLQSGTASTNTWYLKFNDQQRWENPLMGWASNSDPLSNIELNFLTLESAIDYCERHNYKWQVKKVELPKPKRKSYTDIFIKKKREQH